MIKGVSIPALGLNPEHAEQRKKAMQTLNELINDGYKIIANSVWDHTAQEFSFLLYKPDVELTQVDQYKADFERLLTDLAPASVSTDTLRAFVEGVKDSELPMAFLQDARDFEDTVRFTIENLVDGHYTVPPTATRSVVARKMAQVIAQAIQVAGWAKVSSDEIMDALATELKRHQEKPSS